MGSDPPVDRSGPIPSIFAKIRAELAHVTFLALTVVVAHQLNLLGAGDGYFLRQAVQTYASNRLAQPDGVQRDDDPQSTIHVLQADAFLRVSSLELELADKVDVGRIGGVRPIDRSKNAALLQRFADRLAFQQSKVSLIAVDIDVAPLEEGSNDAKINDALDALRRVARVAVITTSRTLTTSRRARNSFMAQQCLRTTDRFARPLNSIHFASSQAFHEFDQYPLTFPAEFERHTRDLPFASLQPSDSSFPSLGNVIRLLAWPEESHPAFVDRATTLLCEQAIHSQATEGVILEDTIAASAASGHAFRLEAYGERWINWRWLETELVDIVPFGSLREIGPCSNKDAECIADGALRDGVLLIGVDGGARHDKFNGATIAPDPISGATLHALQAISGRSGYGLHAHSLIAVCVDVIAGILFLVLWIPLEDLAERLQGRMPSSHFMILLAGPVLIAALLAYLAIRFVSPALLGLDYWVNPSYLLIAMALHAYLEAIRHGTAHHSNVSAPDFTFGLFRWWHCQNPRLPSLTSTDARTAAAECLDASIALVAQGAIVVVALSALLSHDSHVDWLHQRLWAVIVILLLGVWSWRRQRTLGNA